MKQTKILIYIFSIMGILVFFGAYLQYTVKQSTQELEKDEIKQSKQYAKKISKYIIKNTKDGNCRVFSECIKNSPNVRKKLNDILSAFITDNYTQLFVVTNDNSNQYRFILDAATNEEDSYRTIFFPQSKKFDEVYKTKKPTIIQQSGSVDGIWMSLLYPIIENNTTVALLVLDLSEEYGEHIAHYNSPIKSIVTLIQIFTFLSIAFLIFSWYKAFKLQKRLFIDTLTGANTTAYVKDYFLVHNIDKFDLILYDIDRFRLINDRYSVASADTILKEMVSFVKTLIPADSKIIRRGGGEFLLIIPKGDIMFEELSFEVFEELSIKKYLIDNNIISLSISMSAIKTPMDTKSAYNTIRILDAKLLEIKGTGKNRLEIINNLTKLDVKYKDIEFIKDAIDKESLVCLYQPIYNTKNKDIVKYEALVRIVDTDNPNEYISPQYFIVSIRETIHYIRLSKWILGQVLALLKSNPKIEVSINLDLADLYNEDMLKLIEKELYNNNDLADRLTFEILEYNEIIDYERVGIIFKRLKAFGSKIAIDDFGSGYSNFSYLINLDVDILKIDSSLIKSLENGNLRAKSVIKSIKELGDSHDIQVIAEHVSTEKIYNILLDIGVEFVQGFYLGKPKEWSHNEITV